MLELLAGSMIGSAYVRSSLRSYNIPLISQKIRQTKISLFLRYIYSLKSQDQFSEKELGNRCIVFDGNPLIPRDKFDYIIILCLAFKGDPTLLSRLPERIAAIISTLNLAIEGGAKSKNALFYDQLEEFRGKNFKYSPEDIVNLGVLAAIHSSNIEDALRTCFYAGISSELTTVIAVYVALEIGHSMPKELSFIAKIKNRNSITDIIQNA